MFAVGWLPIAEHGELLGMLAKGLTLVAFIWLLFAAWGAGPCSVDAKLPGGRLPPS